MCVFNQEWKELKEVVVFTLRLVLISSVFKRHTILLNILFLVSLLSISKLVLPTLSSGIAVADFTFFLLVFDIQMSLAFETSLFKVQLVKQALITTDISRISPPLTYRNVKFYWLMLNVHSTLESLSC